jgi:hypothetical protein
MSILKLVTITWYKMFQMFLNISYINLIVQIMKKKFDICLYWPL